MLPASAEKKRGSSKQGSSKASSRVGGGNHESDDDWYKKRKLEMSGIEAAAAKAFTEKEAEFVIHKRHGETCARAEALIDRAVKASPGSKVSEFIRWSAAKRGSRFRYVYHKPRGVYSQPYPKIPSWKRKPRSIEQANVGVMKPYVWDRLPSGFPRCPFAGRLDAETEGLLICSDDGRFLNSISHGKGKCTKEYHVHVVHGRGQNPNRAQDRGAKSLEEKLAQMRTPIDIKSSTTKEAGVSLLREDADGVIIISVNISEGKNHQVRRLCARSGFDVKRLIRVSHGPVTIEGIGPGEARHLSDEEIEALFATSSRENETENAAAERVAEALRERPTFRPV